MKTLILDGSHANDPEAVNILHALHKHLPDAEAITLREQQAKGYGVKKIIKRQPYR